MSTFLLFCMAQVPLLTINTLLQTPRHSFFSLVRDSTQSTFDIPATSPPIAPFISDFSTHDQIRKFLLEHEPGFPPDIEPCQYAIIDHRSTSDNTVILAHSYSSLYMRDPDIMDEAELERWWIDSEDDKDAEDDSWMQWRVKFEDAETMATNLCFENDFTVKLYNEVFLGRYTDGEGVFRLADAFKAFVGTEMPRDEL